MPSVAGEYISFVGPLKHAMASRRKENDLGALAQLAERAKAAGDPSGFVSGSLFSSEFEIVLGGCIDFHPGVPEFERKRIVSKVAHAHDLQRPITPESLLRHCSKLEQEYLALPLRKFRLLTEVSIWWTIDVPKTTIGQTTLTFKPKDAKGFNERSRLFGESKSTLGFDLPQHYMRLSAHVSARTPHEATEYALNDIDLVRASWNLSLNRGKAWRHTGGRPVAINDIRLSPFHTLHDIKGNLATETYWYDPGYSKPATLFSDKTKFAKLLAFAKSLRARLAQLPYRTEIEGALIRYVRALDSADLNDAFLRLWSLLEYLTDSTHDPYKVATRRAAFMFADRERTQLVLAHLTNHRNRFVHAGSDSDEIESLVFLLKRYVDSLLLFHLGNRLGFATRAEVASFMELPHRKEGIDQRIKRLREARRFISGGA